MMGADLLGNKFIRIWHGQTTLIRRERSKVSKKDHVVKWVRFWVATSRTKHQYSRRFKFLFCFGSFPGDTDLSQSCLSAMCIIKVSS
ncbi:hypothetical protein VTO42DRAFT_827 [Malbranchea cinnamomea]